MKKAFYLLLSVVLLSVFVSCDGNVEIKNNDVVITRPEGAPESTGTYEELKAYVCSAYGEELNDEDIAAFALEIVKEGTMSEYGSEELPDDSYTCHGAQVKGSTIIIRYWGTSVVSNNGEDWDFEGYVQWKDFVFGTKGKISEGILNVTVVDKSITTDKTLF